MLKNFLLSYVLFLSLFLGKAYSSNMGQEEAVPKEPVKMAISIFADGNTHYLALSYKNHEHWHTYWKNPGDAGLPIKFHFKVSGEDIRPKELEWPIPQRFIEEGNMLAYGYENQYSLFFELDELQLNSIKTSGIQISSSWLVCKHICIPGKKEYQASYKNNILKLDTPAGFSTEDQELISRKNNLPQVSVFPEDLDINLTKHHKNTENALTLYSVITNKNKKTLIKGLGLLTPFPVSPFSFKHEKIFFDKSNNLYQKMDIDWDGEYSEPELPFPKDGRFKASYNFKFLFNNPKTHKIEIIEKTFSRFSLEAATQFENFFSSMNINTKSDKSAKDMGQQSSVPVKQEIVKTENNSLWYYILFGLIGGLILNFMPCVLPVISIKLFGMIKHQGQSRKKILAHNLSYTFGVLISFMVFATIITLLKSTGETVGWGFQLQSPAFISSMILILFIFTLNLFGLFEFNTPGGNKLGGLQLKDGPIGDFFSGVLATILSTPCSAPFLGTALTFAFSEGVLAIYSIFLSIGLGLALPFILTGLFPSLVAFLPKPGAWMENLKKVLGLTLILTMIWLLDVFSSQVDTSLTVLKLNSALAFIFFLFYMRSKMTKKMIYTLPVLLLCSYLFYGTLQSSGTATNNDLLNEKKSHGQVWQKWSEEKMLELKDSKELVFIDFTAKWCFTCKINERLVLETKGFDQLVEKYNIKLLLADWTKRDPYIGKWLAKNNMVGVPAYFVQTPDGTLYNLGETITLSKIEGFLTK